MTLTAPSLPAVPVPAPQDLGVSAASLPQNEDDPPAPNPLSKEAVPAAHNILPNEAATTAIITPIQAVSAAHIPSSNPASSSNMAPRQQVGLAAVPAVYATGCPPQVAVVNATTVFENCPSSQLG
jgi:hypothetical protein